MFTGIIESTGIVKKWQPNQDGGELGVKPQQTFQNIQIGESIAINGCCLTVIKEKNEVLFFDVSDETMRKTALHELHESNEVNLERALRLEDRLGGHFVLGHVDDIGKISDVKKHDGSVEFQIEFAKKHAELLIEKGSVCVDGISLTVCNLTDTNFSVYIIPHTLEKTHLKNLQKGNLVNLEFDVLGKYILRKQQLEKN